MDRYSKYQEEGDQYVGRCCAGLPQMDERFATVGPFFKTDDPEYPADDPEYLNRCIDIFFPNCPPLLKKVAEHALASLIYHYDYLCSKLAPNSILRDTVLFTQPDYQTSLKKFVKTDILTDSTDPSIPQATGIPPYILLMKQVRALLEQNKMLRLELREVTNNVVQGVGQIIEERALQTNSVTPLSMENMMNDLVARIGSLRGFNDLNVQGNQQHIEEEPPEFEPVQVMDGRRYQAFDWGQLNFQSIPIGYSVPNGVVRNMWLHWMCENTVTINAIDYRVRPLRRISKLKPRNIQELIVISRDLSALKNLMLLLEHHAKQHHDWKDAPNVEEAAAIYHNADLEAVWNSAIEDVDAAHPGKRKRPRARLDQLTWKTISKALGSTRKQGLRV